jgi:hypothetical protein
MPKARMTSRLWNRIFVKQFATFRNVNSKKFSENCLKEFRHVSQQRADILNILYDDEYNINYYIWLTTKDVNNLCYQYRPCASICSDKWRSGLAGSCRRQNQYPIRLRSEHPIYTYTFIFIYLFFAFMTRVWRWCVVWRIIAVHFLLLYINWSEQLIFSHSSPSPFNLRSSEGHLSHTIEFIDYYPTQHRIKQKSATFLCLQREQS